MTASEAAATLRHEINVTLEKHKKEKADLISEQVPDAADVHSVLGTEAVLVEAVGVKLVPKSWNDVMNGAEKKAYLEQVDDSTGA